MQLTFSLFGAVQGGGELFGGVGFVGAERAKRMREGVAVAELEVVEGAGWNLEDRFEVEVFVGEEPGVEAVEHDGLIAGVGDQVLPGVIAPPWGFDQDDPRTEAVEIHAAQDGFFMAFDVNLEEVNGPVGGVLFADRGKGAGLDGEALHVHAEVFALLGNDGVGRGQAGAWNAVEGYGARLVAGDALHGGVARALLAERVVVIVHRFDVDAVPAMVVESFGDRIVARVVGADVDVETVFELLERAPQADVFEVLCIGDERHGRFLSVDFIIQACAGEAVRLCIARLADARNYSLCMAAIRRLCRFDWRLMHNGKPWSPTWSGFLAGILILYANRCFAGFLFM